MGCFKALILRDDEGKLCTVADRLKTAVDVAKKTFNLNPDCFRVIDVFGPHRYGYVAVYEVERSTVPVGVREWEKDR